MCRSLQKRSTSRRYLRRGREHQQPGLLGHRQPPDRHQSVSALIADGVAAIIGAASSSVSLNVVDDIANAGIVQISPANTSTALSGYSQFYFRTAPPDTVQGSALGNLIVDDGIKKIGILLFADDYATSLRDVVRASSRTRAARSPTARPVTSSDRRLELRVDRSGRARDQPRRHPLIAFDQTKNIVPALIGAGYPADKLYFADGNTADYSADFDAGHDGRAPRAPSPVPTPPRLQDAPGRHQRWQARLLRLRSQSRTTPPCWRRLLHSRVVGRTVRPIRTTWRRFPAPTVAPSAPASGRVLRPDRGGEEINYQAVSGVGPFNADNDPSSAYMGVYMFDDANVPQWTDAVFGEV